MNDESGVYEDTAMYEVPCRSTNLARPTASSLQDQRNLIPARTIKDSSQKTVKFLAIIVTVLAVTILLCLATILCMTLMMQPAPSSLKTSSNIEQTESNNNESGICLLAMMEIREMRKIAETHELLNADGLRRLLGTEAFCYMGLKSRYIENKRITASSYHSAQHEPYRARLDNNPISGISTGSWSAKQNMVGQWLQVDLGSVEKVAGVITQGRPNNQRDNQWVKNYTVSCGANEHSLKMVQQGGQVKVYAGNSDMSTKVYNRFPAVLNCRFIRIYPQSWNEHISMRIELVAGACYDGFHL